MCKRVGIGEAVRYNGLGREFLRNYDPSNTVEVGLNENGKPYICDPTGTQHSLTTEQYNHLIGNGRRQKRPSRRRK